MGGNFAQKVTIKGVLKTFLRPDMETQTILNKSVTQPAVANSTDTASLTKEKAISSVETATTVALSDMPTTSHSNWMTDLVNTMVGAKPAPMTISVTKNENNQINLETADGYKLNFTGKKEEWKIIAPNGTSTRIWGDPHVVESDGTKWDFTKQSTFIFGNNKVTVETIPSETNKKYTYTQRVTLHNGSDRITITDIQKNKPVIEHWRFDAASHDASQSDGNVYKLVPKSGQSFDWKKQS